MAWANEGRLSGNATHPSKRCDARVRLPCPCASCPPGRRSRQRPAASIFHRRLHLLGHLGRSRVHSNGAEISTSRYELICPANFRRSGVATSSFRRAGEIPTPSNHVCLKFRPAVPWGGVGIEDRDWHGHHYRVLCASGPRFPEKQASCAFRRSASGPQAGKGPAQRLGYFALGLSSAFRSPRAYWIPASM